MSDKLRSSSLGLGLCFLRAANQAESKVRSAPDDRFLLFGLGPAAEAPYDAEAQAAPMLDDGEAEALEEGLEVGVGVATACPLLVNMMPALQPGHL